ncbi:hypothetical protein [Enterococcus faecalis]|uniref:hypothetical protein n=1 Tax=Enterococcus faecalis TaxID=1351 RepID=UPI003DA0DEC0
MEFGFVDPPIFNKRTGNLVGGNKRISVAKDLGIDKNKFPDVSYVNSDGMRMHRAFHKISGQWDEDKLALSLNVSKVVSRKLAKLVFNDEEIQEVIDQYGVR